LAFIKLVQDIFSDFTNFSLLKIFCSRHSFPHYSVRSIRRKITTSRRVWFISSRSTWHRMHRQNNICENVTRLVFRSDTQLCASLSFKVFLFDFSYHFCSALAISFALQEFAWRLIQRYVLLSTFRFQLVSYKLHIGRNNYFLI